jgi:hypothetical protein
MPVSKQELRQLIQQANDEVDSAKIMLSAAQDALVLATENEKAAQEQFQNANDAREALKKTLKALHGE